MAEPPARCDELQVVLDVDGVTRRGITDRADPGVVDGVKQLLAASIDAGVKTEVAFVSGTPSTLQEADVPDWCQGNVPLIDVFAGVFSSEVAARQVQIFGQLGADRLLVPDGGNGDTLVGVVDRGFTHRELIHILDQLLALYHADVEATDRDAHQILLPLADECLHAAKAAAVKLDVAAQSGNGPKLCTRIPPEFEPYALAVRKVFDTDFRLVCNGATVEYHDFKSVGRQPHTHLIVPGHPSSGLAHREGKEFRFVIVTSTNKGDTVGRLVDARRKRIAEQRGGGPMEHELEVITVGDTAIDYPMHELASTPFHVGLPAVWDAHDRAEVAHVALVTRKDGTAPLVDGTILVLKAIVDALKASAEEGRGGFDAKTVHDHLRPSLLVRETVVD